MKSFKLLGRGVFLALCLVSIISMAVYATPMADATTKSLSTNYTLVNLGSNTATVSASYIKPDGSPWAADAANTNFTVAMNFGQKVVAQYFDTTMTAGSGSVVLSSDQPLGAVVQLQARGQTPTNGAYSGIAAPSNKYYIPQLQRMRASQSGITNFQISIQNAEPTGATTVTVDLIPYPGSGLTAYSKTNISIQPGATFLYDLANESSANVSDGWYGSAVVTAGGGRKIAVVVNGFSGANSLQTYNAFPMESVSSSWAVPQFTSRLPNRLSTPVVVQNLSGGTLNAGDIDMNCKSSISTPATLAISNTASVPNNASYVFNPVTDTTIPTNWSGACIVSLANSANGVVYVQMRRPGLNDEFAAYEAFPTNSPYTRAVIPLVSKHQPNGFATTVTVQNLDTSNVAKVRLTYTPAAAYVASGGSATPIVRNLDIAPGGNIQENLRFNDIPAIPDQWYGTLVVEAQPSTTARRIVSYVQLTNWQSPPGDTLMAHDAFGLP